MTKNNSQIVRFCFDCKEWRVDENYLKDDYDNDVFTCPRCEKTQRYAKCNRCGYEWKLHRPTYPNNCPKCKSPYFNNKRIQTRAER